MKLSKTDIEAIERVITMREDGMSAQKIADKIGFNCKTDFQCINQSMRLFRKIGLNVPIRHMTSQTISSDEYAAFQEWKAKQTKDSHENI